MKCYVLKTLACTWKGKGGAPNLQINTKRFDNEKLARQEIQNVIAKICSNKNVENIYWRANHVEIAYNYVEAPNDPTEETVAMDIIIADGDELKFANIGNY